MGLSGLRGGRVPCVGAGGSPQAYAAATPAGPLRQGRASGACRQGSGAIGDAWKITWRALAGATRPRPPRPISARPFFCDGFAKLRRSAGVRARTDGIGPGRCKARGTTT
jgi:hypothetical protein